MNSTAISPIEAINNTIWVTSRVRMISERKAIKIQNLSYFVITYYSLFIILISIFQKYYENPYPALSQINLSASVVILVASLVASGFRLESRAASFRECYLKLQQLHDRDMELQTKKDAYRDLLFDFPNHTPADYADMLIEQTLFGQKELTSGTQKISWNGYVLAFYLMRRTFYYSSVFTIVVAPIFFLTWPFVLWQAK